MNTATDNQTARRSAGFTPAPGSATCDWIRDESGPEETQCGHAFEFTYDSVKENGFKFCPFCGGAIIVKEKLCDHDWQEKHDDAGQVDGGPGDHWTWRECRVCGEIESPNDALCRPADSEAGAQKEQSK